MNRRSLFHLTTAMLLMGAAFPWPAVAADVTPERLLNADNEPQNWLMNHRSPRCTLGASASTTCR
jgi:hypothetical protein